MNRTNSTSMEHLDTILAFAAAMAGFSLIVTALTQAVSALVGLRGLNLKWGLEKLFATLSAETGLRASPLAHHVLLHPLISDSTFSGVRRWFSWWRYANHIRQEELSGLLAAWKHALNRPAATSDEKARRDDRIKALNLEALLEEVAREAVSQLLVRIQVSQALLSSCPDGPLKTTLSMPTANSRQRAKRAAALRALTLEAIRPDFDGFVQSVIRDPSQSAMLSEMRPLLPEKIRDAVGPPQGAEKKKELSLATLPASDVLDAFLDQAARSLVAQITAIEAGLKGWFDSSMGRISQRFATNMRMVTVAGAGIVSLTLVIDGLDLWQKLSRSPDLRAKVIASSDALLKQAEAMQAGAANVPAGAYRAAANQMQALHTNEFRRLVSTAAVTNRFTGTNWLVSQCLSNGISNLDSRLEEYEALVPQVALRQAADSLQTALDHQLALGLIPSRPPGESWLQAVGNHFGGVLISIVFLSLGAPFWFNLLRSLSNLRPVLASKEGQEERARPRPIEAGTAGG
jgi:hypothetical protein